MSARAKLKMARMSVLDLRVDLMPMDLHARFWSKVTIPDDPDACWLWTGAVSTPSIRALGNRARPRFRLTRNPNLVVYAHRFALALKLGLTMNELNGFEACHAIECSSVLCVNGRHLYRGTADENRDDRYPWRRLQPELEL